MGRPRVQTTVREILVATFWFGVALGLWRFAPRTAFPPLVVTLGLAAGCLACAALVGRTWPVIQVICYLVAVGVGALPTVILAAFILFGVLGVLPGGGLVRP